MGEKLLEIVGYHLRLNNNVEQPLLNNVHLSISKGEILALVGESGSGKSLLARSILQLNSRDFFTQAGEILFEELNLAALNENAIAQIRGKRISMIFQEAISYLNPTMKVGKQICEPLIKHQGLKKKQAAGQVDYLLESMAIQDPTGYRNQYPYQLSGGMAQRGMIAMGIACAPSLLIADEPTSSLDRLNQIGLIQILREMKEKHGMAILFITHDLQLASMIADRIAVMDKGNIVEANTPGRIMNNPVHQSTRRLMNAFTPGICPKVSQKNNQVVLELKNITKSYQKAVNHKAVVDDVSLNIYKGEALGILGESGCGKTTLARLITGIEKPDHGSILLEGRKVSQYAKLYLSRKIQMIFQNPLASLDPSMKVKDILWEGCKIQRLYDSNNKDSMVDGWLEKVGLNSQFRNRYPYELSGGQRQRVSIARALMMEADILICDEPTSYLDSVSQSQIIQLLLKLKSEKELTYLFISHDLRVLEQVCDRIASMKDGKITIKHTDNWHL